MSHTYSSSLFHCVFSTNQRKRFIKHDLAERLWPFLGGIARDNDMEALAVGGVEDHIHILLSFPTTITIAKAMQLLEGASSKWVHETFPERQAFAWQEGYGAFSIGISQVDDTIGYIHRQAEHHHKKTFEEEFLSILDRHGIEYDPRFVWG
jgi:REP element-mobilizing transposase RayT